MDARMDTTRKRVYQRRTRYTRLLSARVPLEVADRLYAYVACTGQTITDVLGEAVREYLAHHSPLEAGGEEARG